MNIKELKHRRETYGHDDRAINRHSIRVYQVSGVKRGTRVKSQGMKAKEPWEFSLSRTLDGCPPFYSLYFYRPGSVLPTHLTINGDQYWGGGLSWPKRM
jgi:hypothetical protein